MSVLALVVVIFLVTSESDAAPEQPIDFSHQIHVAENGMPCQYCHSTVHNSPVASIPSVEKCMGCHNQIAIDSPGIVALTEYWENGEPIPWERVHNQPSYVYFSHQAHVAAEVSCGSCHGDVASMAAARQVVHMNMGFCLDCHAEQDNGREELYDCVVCHR
ncbi:MAG: cytochrome c3 family protein [Chloroflexi bacterium]|nr:cytochrome c3 family protein [Chloroflexota bacterium]